MKLILKRLAALNLSLLLLVTLLPVTAFAASGQYAYVVINSSGTEKIYYSDELDLDRSYYRSGYKQLGWSLTEGGMPITDPAEVPVPEDENVYLYGCWGMQVGISNYNGTTSWYYLGPIEIDGEEVDPEVGGSGDGWSYSIAGLTLSDGYSGAPIVASADLLINVSGDVTVQGNDGPAIIAGQEVEFLPYYNKDASLTLIGDNAAAIRSARLGSCVWSPVNLVLVGDDVPASYQHIYYQQKEFAKHALLENRTFTGEDEASAEEVDTINVYGDVWTSGSNLEPYLPYIRFEGIWEEDLEITLTLDPNEGTLPDASAGETVVYPVSGEDYSFPNYNDVEIDLGVVPVPTRDGYLFTGWMMENDASRWYTPDETLTTETADTALTAQWLTTGDAYILFNGNGENLISDELEEQAIDSLPLTNGSITLPDLENDGFVGWHTEPVTIPRLMEGDFYEDIYLPGETVSLPSGTMLYALYTNQELAVLHGNGHTTANGHGSILVPAGILLVTDTTLYAYSGAITAQQEGFFQSGGQALLDFNTKADGSGSYSGVVEEDSYAQWTDAAAGSVLLYSYTPANAAGRYGKVLTPQQAADFDPTNDYGFARKGHDFEGWYSGSTRITDTLPAADENGYICLYGNWDPYSITYADTGTKSISDYVNNRIGISKGTSPTDKVFNGWNSKEDGSGTWYLPDETVTLTESITVYPQYLDAPADGSWVLVESLSGPGLYELLTGTATESGKVTVTLPEAEYGWYLEVDGYLPYSTDTFGYCGGKTYTLENQITLFARESADGMFHGNGGTFEDGSEFRSVVITGTSNSRLFVYPRQEDFVTVPEGMTLGGWTEDETLTATSKIYAPATEGRPERDLYAVWDEGNIVYIEFIDKDGSRDESFTLRATAGGTITLPSANRNGYALTGWNDGSKTYPAGSTYTVPADGATLTAVWAKRDMLMVDGKEYSPDRNYDYSNDGTKGWKYEANGNSADLYLYDYEGGPIYLPYYTDILLNGTNTVTGTSAMPAVSGDDYLYFHKDWNNYYTGTSPRSLTLTGGSGMPAVSAYSVQLQDSVEYTLTGGSGAPAAEVEYQVSISSGHVQITGGSGAPAVKTAYSYGNGLHCNNTYTHLFAGQDADHLTEIGYNAYNGEACIVTTPVYYTLTLNAGEGKVNGRPSVEYQVEYNERFDLRTLDTYHSQGKFVTWLDEDGNEKSYNVYLYDDMTLTAQWDVSPYERYVYLDAKWNGTVNGQETAYVELPESGTIRLPEVVIKEEYADSRVFEYWYVRDEDGNWLNDFPANADIPVEWLEHGMTLEASTTSLSNAEDYTYLWLHPNGTTFTDNGQNAFDLRWLDETSFTVERWWGRENAHGYVIDSWNTEPDGSGTTYKVGQTVKRSQISENTVWYAQWKEPLTYSTKKVNDTAPAHNDTYQKYGYTEDGQWMSGLIGWRTEDGSKFYFAGETTDLPKGTTLYSVYGNIYEDATILLYGNGAEGPVDVQFSQTRSYNDDPPIYATTENVFFRREGYKMTGWNTKADGSGTAYPMDAKFKVGKVTSSGDWKWDETLMAKLPDALYAQWERETTEIPVPQDMLEVEDAMVLAGVYDENGKCLGVQYVKADESRTAVPSGFDSYQFFCVSDDAALAPLMDPEVG